MNNTIIFALSASKKLAEKVVNELGIELSPISVQRFADGEILVTPEITVRGQDVAIIQSISDPINENLMELLIAIDALKRSSANSINVIIPYMGYARQDRKTKPHEPITFKLVANMLTIAGATRVLTFDIHSDQTQGFFDIPFDSIKASLFLLDYFINKTKIGNFVVVSPDYGGVKRARDISLTFDLPLAIVDKRRPAPNQVEVTQVLGDINGKHCVMFDDMIDTGGTVIAASKLLKEQGAKSVSILVTHGLFNKNAADNFNDAISKGYINNILVTDTIEKDVKINGLDVVTVAKPIAKVIELFKKGTGSLSYIIKDGHSDLSTKIKKYIANHK